MIYNNFIYNIIYMNTTNHVELLKKIITQQEEQFNFIVKELDIVKSKQDYLENLIKNNTNLNKTNISIVEDKIQYLNTHYSFPITTDIVEYYDSICNIEEHEIHEFIEKKGDLYNFIIEIIYNLSIKCDKSNIPIYPLNGKGNHSYIYYWDYKNSTWSKFKKGDDILKSIFMKIHDKIIRKYNQILLNNNNMKHYNIESGDLIFIDIDGEFDKKFNTIKKTLFSKFI